MEGGSIITQGRTVTGEEGFKGLVREIYHSSLDRIRRAREEIPRRIRERSDHIIRDLEEITNIPTRESTVVLENLSRATVDYTRWVLIFAGALGSSAESAAEQDTLWIWTVFEHRQSDVAS